MTVDTRGVNSEESQFWQKIHFFTRILRKTRSKETQNFLGKLEINILSAHCKKKSGVVISYNFEKVGRIMGALKFGMIVIHVQG